VSVTILYLTFLWSVIHFIILLDIKIIVIYFDKKRHCILGGMECRFTSLGTLVFLRNL
jgi:hypothetical protein